MDKLKTYFVEVVLKKITKAGVTSAVSALVVFLAAHANYLEKIGFTTFTWDKGWPFPNAQPSGLVTVIEWDTLQVGGATALFVLVSMAYKWFEHHSVATVKGLPQSGDKRQAPTVPIEGGRREEDTKETQ